MSSLSGPSEQDESLAATGIEGLDDVLAGELRRHRLYLEAVSKPCL